MTFLEAVGAAALPSLCAVTSVEKVLVQFSSIQDHLLQNCFPELTSGDEGLVVITMKVWEVVKGKRMVVPALRYPYVGPDLLTLLTDPRFPFQCNCTRMVWLFGDLFLCMDRLQSKQKFIAHLDIKLENLGVVLEDGGKPAALKLLDLETAGQILPDYTGGVPALLGRFIYDTNRRDLETAFPTYGGDVMLSDLGMMYHVIVPEFGMYRSMTSALVDMQMRFDAARSVVQVEDVHACLASWLQAFRRHRSTVDAGNTIPAAVHTFLTQMILGPAIPEDDRPPQWTDLQWTFYMETYHALAANIDAIKQNMDAAITNVSEYFTGEIPRQLAEDPDSTWKDLVYGEIQELVLLAWDSHSMGLALTSALTYLLPRRGEVYDFTNAKQVSLAMSEREESLAVLRYVATNIFGAPVDMRWVEGRHAQVAQDIWSLMRGAGAGSGAGASAGSFPTGGRRRRRRRKY